MHLHLKELRISQIFDASGKSHSDTFSFAWIVCSEPQAIRTARDFSDLLLLNCEDNTVLLPPFV